MASQQRSADSMFRLHVVAICLVALCLLPTSTEAATAKGQYSMNLNSDCVWAGRLDVKRDQTVYLNGKAPSSAGSSGSEAASCRLQFGPESDGDTLELEVMSNAYISDCETSLTVSMTGNSQVVLGCQSDFLSPPKFEAQNGVATVIFKRRSIAVTQYYFQVAIRAYRTVAKEPPGSSNDADVGLIVGIVAGVILLIVLACILCICCWRRRRESIKEKNQFINGTVSASGPEGVSIVGTDGGVYNKGVYAESPGSNRRLLSKRIDGSSEDGGESSVGGKSRSALDRFGVAPPSQRRRQQVGPNEEEGGRRRDAFQTESEVDAPAPTSRRPQPQPRGDRDGFKKGGGGASQDYEDVDDKGYGGGARGDNRSPPASPLMSALRNNPRFRRSFHENEADAEERARRVSDRSSGESYDSRDPDGRRPGRPKLPPVPRSPSRSPSPQRRGEKIAAIFRARPSSSVDAARLDSDRSEDTPPKENAPRDTRHTLRPDRRRGRSRGDEDYDDPKEEEERRKQQKRRDREDEERQRRRRQEEEEEEEEERRRRRKEEERRRREEQEEREEEEQRRKQEKKKKEEERRRREEEDRRLREEEEEEERQRRRRAAKESDGSEYEGRFKKSASGRRSKGKGPRMGRSRSTGNALEEMDERYQRSRSKSPGSAHSLNFVEGEEDETDLDSNYQPFRRAGSKTSLYASRSSLYGRRRKNSMGETVSVSSRTALDDTDSRMGDFDRSRMSQTELRRLFKSTGELEMRPESAQVVREVGTSTARGGYVSVFGRKTLAKGRHGKRYSRGTQTPGGGGRDRRDSVGSAKSGRSTGSRHRLKSRSKSKESLGGRRSRSRDLSEDDSDSDARSRKSGRRAGKSRSRDRLNEAASDDGSDTRSKRSGRSGRHKATRPRKSNHSAGGLSDSEDDSDGHIADDQSVAPSSVAPSSVFGGSPQYPQGQPYPTQYAPPYGTQPQMVVAAAPGYPPTQLIYQPVVAPGGPPLPPPPPAAPAPMLYGTPGAGAAPTQKPAIPPKPKPKPAAGSRWDELVNLTEGMKKRRRQMGESLTEDGTESVLSSMWSQPTYTQQQQHQVPPRAPPSYNTAQRLGGDLSYSSNYPDSSGAGAGVTPPRDARNTRMASYSPSESNV